MGLVSGMVFRCTIVFLERSRWRFDVRSFVLFVGVFVLVLCLHHVCGFLVYGFGSPSGSFVGECYLFVLGMSVVIGGLFDCGLLLLVGGAVGLCRFLVSLMGCWGQTGFVLFVFFVVVAYSGSSAASFVADTGGPRYDMILDIIMFCIFCPLY